MNKQRGTLRAGVLFCGDSMVSNGKGLRGSRPGIAWDEAKAGGGWARGACSGHGPVVREAANEFPI